MIHDPLDGKNLFNITNVPSGTMEYGPNGEILIYQLNIANRWLAMWNFTELFRRQSAMTAYRPIGQVINGSDAYSWNVTIPAIQTGSTIRYTKVDDILLFSNIATTYAGRYGTNDPYTVGAINLKPTSRGSLMWMTPYPAPQPQNTTIGVTRVYLTTDPVNRVFMMRDKETLVNYGYSIDTGILSWTTQPLPQVPDWEYFSTSGFTAYGKLYYSGYGGILYAFDTKDGKLLWTYGNGGAGNSTNTGLQTPYGLYPIHVGSIADGKIYTFSSEHSPNEPLYKNTYVRCINATTGEEIWTLMSWANPGSFMAAGIPTADGYIAYLNLYDHQIYVIGKGPSATTVSASPKVSVHGNSVLVEGSVIDLAAGTKQNEQAARFPNGVPAVSDASMGEWMEYVYMQKPRPTDVTGVEVVVSVLDPNNNYYEVGRATSDANGMFGVAFTPEVPGKYVVYASFAGSGAYYGSSAETFINVEEAPAATPPPTPTPAPMTDTYVMGFGIGMIIAIVAIGLVIILLVRKR
jgi:outer membrane protein assembly factor BamB